MGEDIIFYREALSLTRTAIIAKNASTIPVCLSGRTSHRECRSQIHASASGAYPTTGGRTQPRNPNPATLILFKHLLKIDHLLAGQYLIQHNPDDRSQRHTFQ